MVWRQARIALSLVCTFAAIMFPCIAAASEYHGQVTFGGLPLPGATVTVTQGTKKVTAVTDQGGLYTFPDLTDGSGKIQIEMLCFSTVTADVTISSTTAPGKWELTLTKEKVDGRYSLILKKLEDGWRIVHDHTSG